MVWRVKRPSDKDAGGAHIGHMGADEDAAPEAIFCPKRSKSGGALQPPDRNETFDAGH